MKPIAGRMVHYEPTPSQLAYAAADASGVIPAMITGVQPSGAVNLYLFPNCGAGAMWVGTITHGDGPGKWRWPTQVAVSKPHDDDEADPDEPFSDADWPTDDVPY